MQCNAVGGEVEGATAPEHAGAARLQQRRQAASVRAMAAAGFHLGDSILSGLDDVLLSCLFATTQHIKLALGALELEGIGFGTLPAAPWCLRLCRHLLLLAHHMLRLQGDAAGGRKFTSDHLSRRRSRIESL